MKRIILILLFPFLLFADIPFNIDYASFRAEDNKVLVEVYSLFPRKAFKYMPTDEGKFLSNGLISYALVQNDTVIVFERYNYKDEVEDTTAISETQKVPDLSVFRVDEGEYTLLVQFTDLNSKESSKFEKVIYLKAFNYPSLHISDLEFATQIEKSTKTNRFTKFGYDIVPNAGLIYTSRIPSISAFAEIYGLSFNDKNPSTFIVQYEITDLSGKILNSFPPITKRKAGNSAVEINMIPILFLNNGTYILRLNVTDEDGSTHSRSKKFYVFKEIQTPPSFIQEEDEYSMMELEALDMEFARISILMKTQEKKQYKKADLEGKRNVLRNFWSLRNPNPGSPINEFKLNFEKRLGVALDKYPNRQGSTGVLTDRARVFLQYGDPNEIDKHPVILVRNPGNNGITTM